MFFPFIIQESIYTNSVFIAFNKARIQMDSQKHFATIYHCKLCGKFLLSKTGANNHCCYQKLNNRIDPNSLKRHVSAFHSFLRFIATSNISFRSCENKYLERTFQKLDPFFSLPKRDKLCSELIEFSKIIHQKMLKKLVGKTVSLMVDGCTRWGTKYQGFVIYTYQRLYVFSLYDIPNNRSKTLANLIAAVISQLKANQTTVIAVCTDNARYNIHALNNDENSAQHISGQHFIRQPCAAHTANLVIKDMFLYDAYYGFVSSEINILMKNKPENSYRKGFSPELKTERWSSLLRCTQFIRENYALYQSSNNEEVNNALKKLNELIGLDVLESMLQIMWILIERVEKDLSCIADIVPAYLNAIKCLKELSNKPSQIICEYLKKRFFNTLSLNLPMFAFLLTKDGLDFYRKHHLSNSNILKASLNGFLGYQRERKFDKIKIGLNRFSFINYLLNFDISKFDDFPKAIDFWQNYKELNDKTIRSSFVQLAVEVLQIPSSEAAVERLFSALSLATKGEMCNSHIESLNARLIVKFDSIFKDAGSIPWEKFADKIKEFSS